MTKTEKVISFYPKPKDLNLEVKNLSIHYSNCLFDNYKQAKIRIKIGDFHSALLLCNKCLEINDTFIKAVLLKAFVFFELNDNHRAYSNIFLVEDLDVPRKDGHTLASLMLIRYLLNCSKGRRVEIVNYLQYLKKIRHEYVYDV